jgi:hypothetical protein
VQISKEVMNHLALLDHDLQRVREVYDKLGPKEKLEDVPNSREFMPMFFEVFEGNFLYLLDYVDRETHYALSNAGYVFSGSHFENIDSKQYLRVRAQILEALVHQEIKAIRLGGKFWWESMMNSLGWIFGETLEERNKAVRGFVASESFS